MRSTTTTPCDPALLRAVASVGQPARSGEAPPAVSTGRPTVVVYVHSLLEPSMTFVVSHAEALARYQAVYAGAHRVRGLTLPDSRVVTVNEGGMLGPVREFLFRQFGQAGRACRRLRAFGPSVVHAHFGPSGPAALVLAESLDIPLVLTFHGRDATLSDEEFRRTWRGREFLRGRARVMQRAAVIVAVSDFIRQRLLEQGYPADKVVTHRNGIDLEQFHGADADREPIAVFAGRFVEKKGCEYFLHALGQLRREGRPVKGVLIGDGPLRSRLEQIAGEASAEVEFTGFLPTDQVRQWLGRASVVVVPSVTAADGDSEGLPTVILEAQAMRAPVIATRHAGNAEGVAEGRSALLVEERDVPALAEAINCFMDDQAAVAAFGNAGRAYVEANFDIRRQAAGLEALYDLAFRRHRV